MPKFLMPVLQHIIVIVSGTILLKQAEKRANT
jgi:hypothetical protein